MSGTGVGVGSSVNGTSGANGVGVGSNEIGSPGTTTMTVAVASEIGVALDVGKGVGVDDGSTGITELGSIPGGTMITPG
jgi:hypothetical protein